MARKFWYHFEFVEGYQVLVPYDEKSSYKSGGHWNNEDYERVTTLNKEKALLEARKILLTKKNVKSLTLKGNLKYLTQSNFDSSWIEGFKGAGGIVLN